MGVAKVAKTAKIKSHHSYAEKKRFRKHFGNIPEIMEIPELLEIQLQSYQEFLQPGPDGRGGKKDAGLEAAFKSVFPIESYS